MDAVASHHFSSIYRAFRRLTADERITVWHLSLYMGIVYCWHEQAYAEQFSVSRMRLMQLAHIRSIVTYHKCMKELVDYGYIHYLPSYHPLQGSSISLLLL